MKYSAYLCKICPLWPHHDHATLFPPLCDPAYRTNTCYVNFHHRETVVNAKPFMGSHCACMTWVLGVRIGVYKPLS